MAISNILAYGGISRVSDVGASFASDVSRRISGVKSMDVAWNAATDDPEAIAAQDAKTAQLQKLESALGGTVAYMANAHGEKAASAMIGIVYKRLGDGDIDEESLGNAFLDVTRFIDANFGTDKGDDFMAHLNGNLNTAMNAVFDNGLNETFMVAPSSQGGGTGVAGILDQITEQYTESVKKMIEEARAKPDAASPAAAYVDQWRSPSMLQGVLKDIVV